MATINPRRVTHAYDGEELAVFLIGMRINRPWRIRQWWQVFAAMPPMLKELSLDPDSGLLGYRMTLGAGGPTIIQYWNSTDKLYAYASAPPRPAPARLGGVQPPGPENTGSGGHLARNVRGRPR